MYRVGIITASDKGSRGERIDESGQKIKDIQFRVSPRMSAGYSNSAIYYAMIIFGE